MKTDLGAFREQNHVPELVQEEDLRNFWFLADGFGGLPKSL